MTRVQRETARRHQRSPPRPANQATVCARPLSRSCCGSPAGRLPQAPGVETAAPLLPGHRRPVAALAVETGQRGDPVVEHRHVRLDPAPDVVGAGQPVLGRRDIGRDHVLDEHVVPRLQAVAVDHRGLPGEHLAGEDRDHPGLAVRVLTRAVDVGVPQRAAGHAEVRCAQPRYSSPASLETPYGLAGRQRSPSGVGSGHAVAVERPAAGGEDELPDPGAGRALEQQQGPEDVDAQVVGRVLRRDAHARLRREVDDDSGFAPAKTCVQRGGIGDVGLEETRPGGRFSRRPVARLSTTTTSCAGREKGLGHVRADEAGPAGDQNSCHGMFLLPAPCFRDRLIDRQRGAVRGADRVRHAGAERDFTILPVVAAGRAVTVIVPELDPAE